MQRVLRVMAPALEPQAENKRAPVDGPSKGRMPPSHGMPRVVPIVICLLAIKGKALARMNPIEQRDHAPLSQFRGDNPRTALTFL